MAARQCCENSQTNLIRLKIRLDTCIYMYLPDNVCMRHTMAAEFHLYVAQVIK